MYIHSMYMYSHLAALSTFFLALERTSPKEAPPRRRRETPASPHPDGPVQPREKPPVTVGSMACAGWIGSWPMIGC